MTVPPLLVEVNNLTLRFGAAAVVRRLSFGLPRGQVTALIGESGSGKSLTALALAGLLPPGAAAEGEIRWPERPGAAPPRPGRDIGLVFQDPMSSLHPVLTLGEQIAEAAVSRFGGGWRDHLHRAAGLLERVGLPAAMTDAYPHELSGGQRQRVAIAAALAGEPDLLIADEPTTALDVRTQAQVMNLLSELQRERSLTLLLITHDLALAAQRADAALVLYAGQRMEAAPVRRLLSAPRHPYTRGLIATSLDLSRPRTASLPEIPGSLPDPAALPPGCPFAPRCAKADGLCGQIAPDWTGTAADGVACHRPEGRP